MRLFLLLIFCLTGLFTYGQNTNLYNLDFDLIIPTDSTAATAQTVFKMQEEPVVIAFWLTTCRPCLYELKTYTKLYEQWREEANFQLYAISIDFPNRYHRIDELTQELKLPFPVYWDSRRQFKSILPGGLNGLPQVFIFDKNGKIAYHHKGFQTGDEERLFEKVKELQ